MTKVSMLSFVLLLMAVVMATVTSFRVDEGAPREFGKGDFFDRKYQSWLAKRGLGQPSSWGFGRPVGDHYRYFNWKNYFDNAISKRQLSFGPRSFGSYRTYFTDGLQDWKNTFRGNRKRDVLGEDDPMI
ncbi:uncharacterized protein LOC143294070 [Babylonia areolata]|uniref:uncharacterized protein LOC143294070 n=1 Tax=Babylonia areolata TaxID=304850 RepID=UPI003FD03DEB